MRFDEDPPTPTPEGTGDLPGRSRRRAARPWSNPSAAERPGFDRPVSEADWSKPGTAPRTRPPATPPIYPALGAPEAEPVDLSPVLEQLTALQAQVTALEAAAKQTGSSPDVLTGAELAAAIEGLGTALGGGMATLLTEHRNLLARDLTQAGDRILEEVGVRLRAATTQTVDSVEERIRHVVTRAFADVGEQLELRLDKLQGDVTGLRAVMLEIPDQTAVTERLDALAETVTNSRNRAESRTSPAVTAAIEKSVAAPLGRIEETVHSIVDVVRELLDERLPEDLADAVATAVSAGGEGGLPDTATLEALTAEMTALRRRIAVRPGSAAIVPEPEPEDEDEEPEHDLLDELEIEVERPAKKATRAKAAPKPVTRGRRSRRID
jgi:hypothetical protein